MSTMNDNNGGTMQTNQPHDQDVVLHTPRTAWEVIENACTDRVSGELTVTTASPTKTKVYMTNGLVYFAERETDETLATRLVLAGALNLEQLHRGTIRLNGVEHLGRMFERDATIDRDAVELAIELITEQTLTDIAEQHVVSYRISLYRQHSSGIARWFSAHHTVEEELPDPPAALLVETAPEQVEERHDEPAATLEAVEHTEPAQTEAPGVADEEFPSEAALSVEEVREAPNTVEPEFADVVEVVVADRDEEDDAVAAALSILAPWEPDAPVTIPEWVVVNEVRFEDVTVHEITLEETIVEEVTVEEITVDEVVHEPIVAENAAEDVVQAVDAEDVETDWEPIVVEAGVDEAPLADSTAEPATEPVAAELTALASPWGAPQPSAMAIGLNAPPIPPLPPSTWQPVVPAAEPRPVPVLAAAEPAAPVELPEVAAEEIIEEVTEEPQPVEVVEPAPSLTRMANPLPSDLTTLTPLYGNLQPLHRLTPLTDATNVVPDSKPPIEEVKPAVEDRPVDEPLPASASIGSLSSLLSDEPSDRFNVMSAMASMPTTNPVQVTPSPTPTSHQGLVVPDLGSIPVPEDVAAAVRRAITAIEAATLAPTGATPITFGPLHVTAVGQATTNGDSTLHQLGGSSNGPAVAVAQANSSWGSSDPAVDDSVPEAIWAPMPQKSKPPQPLHALQPQVLHTMHPQMQQPQILQPDESADVITDVPADASGSVMSLSGNDAMATLSPLALPTLPPPEIFHNNPVAAPISTKRRGALRRLIDGIRGR